METATIASELKCVLVSVKAIPTCKAIALKSASKYFHAVVKQVNVSEEAHDKQRKNIIIVLIKILSLSNNIANLSDTQLAWIIFQKISHMHRDITKHETLKE